MEKISYIRGFTTSASLSVSRHKPGWRTLENAGRYDLFGPMHTAEITVFRFEDTWLGKPVDLYSLVLHADFPNPVTTERATLHYLPMSFYCSTATKNVAATRALLAPDTTRQERKTKTVGEAAYVELERRSFYEVRVPEGNEGLIERSWRRTIDEMTDEYVLLCEEETEAVFKKLAVS